MKWAKLFHYYTVKQVAVQDKFLGAVYQILRLCVVGYFIGYSVVYRAGYLENEVVTGITTVSVTGRTLSTVDGNPRIWDETDYAYPSTEGGTAFVPTKIVVTEQSIGYCPSPGAAYCTSDDECPKDPTGGEGKCESDKVSGKRKCGTLQWCPVEDEEPGSKISIAHVMDIKSVENTTLNIKAMLKSSVLYPGDAISTFGGPAVRPIADILKKAKVPLEKISKKGGLFHVDMVWDCGVGSLGSCTATENVVHLDPDDESEGFKVKKMSYKGNLEGRDTYTLTGMQFLVTAKAYLSYPSIMAIGTQLAIFAALFGLAKLMVDTMMLSLLPDRDKYEVLKVENLPFHGMQGKDKKDSTRKFEHLEGFSTGLASGRRDRRGDDVKMTHDMILVMPNPTEADGGATSVFSSLWPFKKEKMSARKLTARRVRLFKRIRDRARLEIVESPSRDNDEIFVKLGATMAVLEDGAERMGLRLKTNDGRFKEFKKEKRLEFVEEESGCLFGGVKRQHIILYLLESSYGAHIDMDKKVRDGEITQWFPVHDLKSQSMLVDTWASAWFNYQPLQHIRDYFGEKISIYFAFLGFYTTWLWGPAVFGIILFFVQMVAHSNDNIMVLVFCIFISIWATLFLEFWKRRTQELAFEWDVMDFEEEERPRQEFLGKLVPDPVTGKLVKFYEPWKRYVKYTFSAFVILVMIGLVFGCLIAIIMFDQFLRAEGFGSVAGPVIGSTTALSVGILNSIYQRIAVGLTDFENHRTDTDWEDALILKTFVFQFVNSYCSLYYIAFFKAQIVLFGAPSTCPDGCLDELKVQLASMFVSKLVVNNIMEVAAPWIVAKLRTFLEGWSGGSGMRLPQEEEEAKMNVYDVMGQFDDYNEIVIQYGYVTLFCVSFPLAPVLALANNLVEIRSDALKLCASLQRPYAKRAEDIGTWLNIMEIMSFMAVITNCLLIGFTLTDLDTLFPGISNLEKLIVIILAEHVLFLIKFSIATLIPDTPDWVQLEIARNEYKMIQDMKRELGEDSSSDGSEGADEEEEDDDIGDEDEDEEGL